MSLERARAVADAVLFEGYALYPYRPTSTKNQLRWQFGVLRAASEATRSDPFWLESQTLFTGTKIEGTLRFLRLRRRQVETPDGALIASLDVDGRLLVPWDEGEVCELPFAHELSQTEASHSFSLAADESVETISNSHNEMVARVRRRRAAIDLRVTVSVERADAFQKLIVRVENLSHCAQPKARRDETLLQATLGTHLILSSAGEFVSLFDPPESAAAAAARCRNTGTYPVLAGEPGRRDLILSAPIILYDHPAIAPESQGDLYDATEIDEILSLRTLLLTDEEKRLARATDGRIAAILDRVEGMPEAAWNQLHGTFRDPRPMVRIGDFSVGAGSRVRLKPGPRRSDAQDMFLEGRTATVREVKRDIDGRDCLAVTVDDDPAAELHDWHGRYHYFYADEVEPLREG